MLACSFLVAVTFHVCNSLFLSGPLPSSCLLDIDDMEPQRRPKVSYEFWRCRLLTDAKVVFKEFSYSARQVSGASSKDSNNARGLLEDIRLITSVCTILARLIDLYSIVNCAKTFHTGEGSSGLASFDYKGLQSFLQQTCGVGAHLSSKSLPSFVHLCTMHCF